MSKYLILLIASAAFIAGGVLGGIGGSRIATKSIKAATAPCPACNCPPATEVKLADFDVKELNNKKGTFNYNPTISNVRLIIEAKDSTLLKQLLKSVK